MDRLLPRTVAESHADTTRMARRLFKSPPPRRMVLPILAFSIMEAFLLDYPSVDVVRVGLGALAIALPAYAAALLTKPVARWRIVAGKLLAAAPVAITVASPAGSGTGV